MKCCAVGTALTQLQPQSKMDQAQVSVTATFTRHYIEHDAFWNKKEVANRTIYTIRCKSRCGKYYSLWINQRPDGIGVGFCNRGTLGESYRQIVTNKTELSQLVEEYILQVILKIVPRKMMFEDEPWILWQGIGGPAQKLKSPSPPIAATLTASTL